MKTEYEIKTILDKNCSPEQKVQEITKFMTWDKKELLNIIIKEGTDTDKQQGQIIKHLWDKTKRRKKDGI